MAADALGYVLQRNGSLLVDSQLLIRMMIDRYRSRLRFASGQASDLRILN